MIRRLLLCFLLSCTACATPKEQPNPFAVQAPHVVPAVLSSCGKALLPLRCWLPGNTPARAVVVALHGFNDYSRAFVMAGEYLSHRGIAVYAYDQRGFGRAPDPGIWAGDANLVNDAADMVRFVHHKYPHVPLYILGESMGGAVAVEALSRPGFPHVNGVILSAPAVWGGDTMNPLFRLTLWSFAHTWPSKILTGEDLHILASDNIPMLRGLGRDPLVIKGTRVDAIYGLVHLMDEAYRDIGKVKVPVFLLYGAHDQVIPPEAILQALKHAPAGTEAAYYPQGYHMLLRDLRRATPTADITAWIIARDEGLPSGNEITAAELAEKLRRHEYSPSWQKPSAPFFPLKRIGWPQ